MLGTLLVTSQSVYLVLVFKRYLLIGVCVCVSTHHYGMCVETRGHLIGVGSFIVGVLRLEPRSSDLAASTVTACGPQMH